MNQVLATDPADGATLFDPKTLQVTSAREGSQFVLSASDSKHPDPVALLTVTAQDAQYQGMSESEVARQWKTLLQPALVAALERRQPAEIRQSVNTVLKFAALGAIATVLILLLAWFIRGRALLVAWTLVWIVLVAWGAAIIVALLQFPQTVAAGHAVLRATIKVAAIWVGAWIVNIMLGVVITRLAITYARRTASSEDRERHVLRAPTISRALGGFKSFVVVFVAALGTLSALEIPIASVVTIGGIAALAIGFAAQTLVRDCLNGMLVLFEDQYVVGDYIMVGDYNGMVESLSLRMVQIRDPRGNLVTIPHSSITQVVNASRTWARLDYRVAVDPACDLKAAVEILRGVLEAIPESPQWRGAVYEAVESIGVELVSKNGVVLRASARCAPLRQYELRRLVNERVVEAFASGGVALGIDPQDVKTIGPTPSPAPL
jgi:small conductance mechanosensitive channel